MALGDKKSRLAKHSHPHPMQMSFSGRGALRGSTQCKVKETSGEKNFGGGKRLSQAKLHDKSKDLCFKCKDK